MATAATWYIKAADQNYAHAQTNLGEMYEVGRGVPQNFTEASNLYRKAAEQGDEEAKKNLFRLSNRER